MPEPGAALAGRLGAVGVVARVFPHVPPRHWKVLVHERPFTGPPTQVLVI